MTTDIRVITLMQPLAGLVIAGWIDVENRDWQTPYRGTIAIHAGGQWAPAGRDHALDLGVPVAADLAGCVTGAIIGTVQLRGIHPSSECDARCSCWARPTRWHWTLASPRRLAVPIPHLGHPGLRVLPADIARQVVAA